MTCSGWKATVACMVRVLALGCAVELSLFLSDAGAPGAYIQVARPIDIPTERLERPRPEQDRAQRSRQKPVLRHADVIGLAKVAAKKELGKSFDDYELKAVVFDPSTNTWSVTFDPKPPRRSSEGCLIMFVRDDTKDTDLARCS